MTALPPCYRNTIAVFKRLISCGIVPHSAKKVGFELYQAKTNKGDRWVSCKGGGWKIFKEDPRDPRGRPFQGNSYGPSKEDSKGKSKMTDQQAKDAIDAWAKNAKVDSSESVESVRTSETWTEGDYDRTRCCKVEYVTASRVCVISYGKTWIDLAEKLHVGKGT